MRKLTEKEIARLLAARATPEPPSGLADRIKADIPGSIRIERAALQPARRWLLPPLVDGLQPSWLAAASVLLVLSVGIVAARIPAQPDDVWKWMALSGVVHIDDIVVTAAAPLESERTVMASAQAVPLRAAAQRAPRTSKGEVADRNTESASAPRRQDKPLQSAAAVAKGRDDTETAPAAGTEVAGGTETRASSPGASAPAGFADAARERWEAGATVATEQAMPSARAARAVAGERGAFQAAAHPAPALARPAASLSSSGRPGACHDCVTVVVLDDAGAPLPGATVTLERIGQGGTWSRTARTETDGTVTFREVMLSMYHVLVTAPAFAPARSVVTVSSGAMPTRTEVRIRPIARR